MTDKQLKRLAKVNGWIEHRKGGKHEIWRRGEAEQITIPYRPRSTTAKLIAKRLAVAA
jgi:predicted RNA binding protein YcfA (HicA-like mRNA interferase family)